MKDVRDLKVWLDSIYCGGCYKKDVCKLEPRKDCKHKHTTRRQGIVQVAHGS